MVINFNCYCLTLFKIENIRHIICFTRAIVFPLKLANHFFGMTISNNFFLYSWLTIVYGTYSNSTAFWIIFQKPYILCNSIRFRDIIYKHIGWIGWFFSTTTQAEDEQSQKDEHYFFHLSYPNPCRAQLLFPAWLEVGGCIKRKWSHPLLTIFRLAGLDSQDSKIRSRWNAPLGCIVSVYDYKPREHIHSLHSYYLCKMSSFANQEQSV